MATPTTRNTSGTPTEVGEIIDSKQKKVDSGLAIIRLHGPRSSDGVPCITVLVNGTRIRTFGYANEVDARTSFEGI